MNRNQKIALGCGGAGCLGLIVVAVASVLIYFFAYRATPYRDDYNFNVSTNRNANTNDNANLSSNSNNENDNTSDSNSSSTSVSSMSDDDKHKLYFAATVAGDAELLRRVEVKLELRDDDYTPGAKYEEFIANHVTWSIRNLDFVRSLNTPEKARTYVNEHFPE